MYCEFNDPEGFRELYDLDADPYNLHNLVGSTSPKKLEEMHSTLLKHQACKGKDCFHPQSADAKKPVLPL